MLFPVFHSFTFSPPLDPKFIGVHLIPESDNTEDDKIFLFFKENAMDGEHTGKATIARIGQLCKVTTHTYKYRLTVYWKDMERSIMIRLQKYRHVYVSL